jgi:hypothetical protein
MKETPDTGFQPQAQPLAMPTGLPPQQQATGVARALAFMRGMSGKAVVLAIAVFGLQAIMPAGSKPSDLIGSFHGGTRSAELDTERAAQVKTAQGMANAQAASPANWQMEQQVSQAQQQAIAGSLQMQQSAANLADAACMGSGLVTAFFGKDGADLAQSMKGACGLGDQIRQNITGTLARTARQGSGVMQRAAPATGVPISAPQR